VNLLVVDTFITDSVQQKDPLLTVQFVLQKHCICPSTGKGMFIWFCFRRSLLMELRERKPSHNNGSLTMWHPEKSKAAEYSEKVVVSGEHGRSSWDTAEQIYEAHP